MAKKRSDGRYSKSFTHEGKRYFVYASKPSELQSKVHEKILMIEKEKAEREARGENYHNPTLRAYYKHFTELRRHEVKESTIRAQAYQFNTVAKAEIGGMEIGDYRIRDLSRRDITEARENLLKRGFTPQRLNGCFAHLNHILNGAVLEEVIDKNPCKALKQLKREGETVRETIHRALSVEETELFFKAATERNSYYINAFRFMIQTGVRIGELSALYPTDIDRKNKKVHIRRTITRDEVGNYIVGEDTKTESGQRMIPANDIVIRIVMDQEELNRKIFGFEAGLLFRSSEGFILREYSINREIKRICKAAGIREFSCHAFRNTFATRFIEQRPQDFKILSEILGHKDIQITLNLYTHVMEQSKVEAMNGIMIKMG